MSGDEDFTKDVVHKAIWFANLAKSKKLKVEKAMAKEKALACKEFKQIYKMVELFRG